ncbi:MAG: four helix bundle protein [Candidatus Levybacteria bacterium]|nr:four helix bundle protein [Candidatus Levybacteria bacterium]
MEIGYRRLIAWQLADKFAWEVYGISDQFPKDELYGLTSQTRRSALSVPLNIVEGYSRNSKNEFRQFLKIALGSLAEAGYLLEFAFKRNYMTKTDYEKIIAIKEECGRVIWKLMKSQ